MSKTIIRNKCKCGRILKIEFTLEQIKCDDTSFKCSSCTAIWNYNKYEGVVNFIHYYEDKKEE